MSDSDTNKPAQKSSGLNLTIAVACLAFICGMVGVSYAAVPLYRIFCQVTGYGGTTQRAQQYSDKVLNQTITVRFDANTAAGLAWDFQPMQRQVTMKIGETTQISYRARNLFNSPSSARASFNVTPEIAGGYFMKVECFCFTDTHLTPGEELEMPVVFFIDPDIADVPEMKNTHTITLSYTMYPIDEAKPAESSQADTLPKTNLGG